MENKRSDPMRDSGTGVREDLISSNRLWGGKAIFAGGRVPEVLWTRPSRRICCATRSQGSRGRRTRRPAAFHAATQWNHAIDLRIFPSVVYDASTTHA
jgi:hypothetical protein